MLSMMMMTMMSRLSFIIPIIIPIKIPIILIRRPGPMRPSRLSMRRRGIPVTSMAIAITIAIVSGGRCIVITVESVTAAAAGDDVHSAVVGGTVTIAGWMVVAVVVVGHFCLFFLWCFLRDGVVCKE